MKKQNEQSNSIKAEMPKPKKERAKRIFFLYSEGHGFIRLDKESGAMPNFSNGEIMSFPTKVSAKYAREFFINLKLAEQIDIFAKIG